MSRPTCHYDDLKPGDSVAFGPVDLTGAIISLGCWRPWPFQERLAHWGFVGDYDGHRCIYESTSDPDLGDCLHAGQIVTGVQVHGILPRLAIHKARGGRAWRLPLVKYNLWGSDEVQAKNIEQACRSQLTVGYDFRGAIASRFALGGWLKWFRGRKPNPQKLLFCSEYGLYVYQMLGLISYRLPIEKYHPKAAARMLVKSGTCGPPEEIVLS